MDEVADVLNTQVISAAGQSILLWHLILLPIGLFLAYWLLIRLVRFIAARLLARGVNPDAVHLLKRAMYVLAISLLVFTTLDIINVPLTAFAFVSGAIAIGVGFGAQNIINNFISGWILMWERPVRIGDFLEVDGVKGVVETINTRSTRIQRVDGVRLLVPNSKLLENTVVNWTIIDRLARTQVAVGVAYGSPVRKVESLLQMVVSEHADVLDTPVPQVIFADFGDNALMFETIFWVNADSEKDLRKIRSDIRYRIHDLMEEAGIVIAFPQRDVHVDGALVLKRPEPRTSSEPAPEPKPDKNRD